MVDTFGDVIVVGGALRAVCSRSGSAGSWTFRSCFSEAGGCDSYPYQKSPLACPLVRYRGGALPLESRKALGLGIA